MAYLTASELRAAVTALTDPAKFTDTTLEDLVSEFAEIAERYRGVAYELRYAVETFLPPRATSVLSLRWAAVRSITSVVVTNPDLSTTTLDSTEYSLDRAASVVVVNVGQDVPVTVTYTHGLGARTVTDGATNSNTSITSATAGFTAADIGKTITGTGIPTGTTISAVASTTAATISEAATATATGVTFTIGTPPAPVLRACREYVRSCALADQSSVPRDVISQSFGDGGYTRYSTPDWEAGRPTGYLEVDRLLNSLDDYRPGFA